MTDACSNSVPKPGTRRPPWTSFVAAPLNGRTIRELQEEGNSRHRVRLEHNRETLLVRISNEDGKGWTTLPIDRPSREWAIAKRERQLDVAQTAYHLLYTSGQVTK
jgi:hypothetical protein